MRVAVQELRLRGVGDPSAFNPVFTDAVARTEKYAETNDTWHDPRADGQIPDVLHRDGADGENVATLRGSAGPSRTCSGPLAEPGREGDRNGFFERRSSR